MEYEMKYMFHPDHVANVDPQNVLRMINWMHPEAKMQGVLSMETAMLLMELYQVCAYRPREPPENF